MEREYAYRRALNESPSEKEGKFHAVDEVIQLIVPSMKVPPKRKGNKPLKPDASTAKALNESPSEKEGKWLINGRAAHAPATPSMKVPPKRKGNTPVSPSPAR